ncbi:hypothetical protein NC651_010066 [Populus alba x Populus x berolinensis]|nr:hypothetical protein NC651_010066 [Populus alba x Populus x berolinensis]
MDIAPWSVYYGELGPSIDGWSYRSACNLVLEEEDDATESSSDGMALQRLKAWKEGWLY